MPLKGARYRIKRTGTTTGGRLAFKGKSKVVEAKKVRLKPKGR